MNASGGEYKTIKPNVNSTCVNFELTYHKY